MASDNGIDAALLLYLRDAWGQTEDGARDYLAANNAYVRWYRAGWSAALAHERIRDDLAQQVVGAAVAYRALLLPNAASVDAELIRRHHAFKAAVDALLAVAPHWGEPRGGG